MVELVDKDPELGAVDLNGRHFEALSGFDDDTVGDQMFIEEIVQCLKDKKTCLGGVAEFDQTSFKYFNLKFPIAYYELKSLYRGFSQTELSGLLCGR